MIELTSAAGTGAVVRAVGWLQATWSYLPLFRSGRCYSVRFAAGGGGRLGRQPPLDLAIRSRSMLACRIVLGLRDQTYAKQR